MANDSVIAAGTRAAEPELTRRSTREVLDEHLALRAAGEVDLDIRRNYAAGVVMLTSFGVFRGREGVREAARLLRQHIVDAKVTYLTRLVHGEIAFLRWTARSKTLYVEDGVDTFLIRRGSIVTKTFHYTVNRCDEPRGQPGCTVAHRDVEIRRPIAKWRLFYNMPTGWHWQCLDQDGCLVGQSAGAYLAREDCLENARQHGCPVGLTPEE